MPHYLTIDDLIIESFAYSHLISSLIICRGAPNNQTNTVRVNLNKITRVILRVQLIANPIPLTLTIDIQKMFQMQFDDKHHFF